MKLRVSLFVLCLLACCTLLAAAQEPIKIGGLFDLSGKAQNIGETTKNVAQMAVDRINKNGGIKGRKLELVVADTQSEPSNAVVALKRLIEKDNVVAVIGPTTTGAAMACLRTVEDAGIPMVACVGGDAPVTPAHTWVFKTPQRTTTAVECLYAYLRAHKLTNIALLGASDKFGQEGEAVLKAQGASFGIKIIAQESFNPTDVDMNVQVAKVAAAKPQAIVVWTIGPAGAIIAKNVQQSGLKIPLFQCHGQPDANYLALAGKAAEGTMMPATKLMVANYLAKSDKQRTVELDFIKEFQQHKIGDIGTHSGYAWDAIQLVCRALAKAGTDHKALQSALEQTKNYIGVSGIYNMSATDHCGLAVNSMVMVSVKNGMWAPAK